MLLPIEGTWESPYEDQLYTFSSDGTWEYEATDGIKQCGTFIISGDSDSGYKLIRNLSNGESITWGVDLKANRLLLNAFDEAGEYPFYRK